jgi:hypothetical protein
MQSRGPAFGSSKIGSAGWARAHPRGLWGGSAGNRVRVWKAEQQQLDLEGSAGWVKPSSGGLYGGAAQRLPRPRCWRPVSVAQRACLTRPRWVDRGPARWCLVMPQGSLLDAARLLPALQVHLALTPRSPSHAVRPHSTLHARWTQHQTRL